MDIFDFALYSQLPTRRDTESLEHRTRAARKHLRRMSARLDARIDDLEQKVGELALLFRSLFEVLHEAPLIIHPDDDTPLGHVIDVYDLTRLVGFDEIQFAVSGDDGVAG